MKKLKTLLDAKKLNFLLKNNNLQKNFNKTLSKILPITANVDTKCLKFPLKINNRIDNESTVSFVYNSKTVYIKKGKFSFKENNPTLINSINSETIFANLSFIVNHKKNVNFNLISTNVDKLI